MRVHIHDLVEGGHVAYLMRSTPDPTVNIAWRSSFPFTTRREAYAVAVTVARLEFGLASDELAH